MTYKELKEKPRILEHQRSGVRMDYNPLVDHLFMKELYNRTKDYILWCNYIHTGLNWIVGQW